MSLEKELDLQLTNLLWKSIWLALCSAHLQPSFPCVILFKNAICGPFLLFIIRYTVYASTLFIEKYKKKFLRIDIFPELNILKPWGFTVCPAAFPGQNKQALSCCHCSVTTFHISELKLPFWVTNNCFLTFFLLLFLIIFLVYHQVATNKYAQAGKH